MWGSQRDYKIVGATLVAARRRAKLTQQELAKRLEKSQSFVSDYERGKRRIDVIEFLVIARTLGVDPLDIFQEILASIPERESRGSTSQRSPRGHQGGNHG
jgi:transcriptional regulator with XRE-family HTH domain